MITLRPLSLLTAANLNRLTGPYLCSDTYRVRYEDAPEGTRFALERVALPEPVWRRYGHIDDAYVREYLLDSDVLLGAYEGEALVGALVAETRDWNRTLWVKEFHVAVERRGQGIGRALMEQAAAVARQKGLRAIVCETQNHNGAAIAAYRRLGFRLEGVDISYYSNEDYPDGDVAVFLKLRLAQ